jgi:hypothetical protein
MIDELKAIYDADMASRGVVETSGIEAPRMGELE